MRFSHLLSAAVALTALASPAAAQSRPVGGAPRISVPSQSNSSGLADMPPACRNHCFSWERGSGFHGGFGNVWVVEREVPVVVKEVVREVPISSPQPSPEGEGTKARKPYVLGASYASLPGGCMKLIEDGVSFYYCSGEWYRQEGKSYRAVARRL